MIIVWGSIEARAGKLEEVLQLCLEHVHRSRSEPTPARSPSGHTTSFISMRRVGGFTVIGTISHFGYIKPPVQNETLVDLRSTLCFYRGVPAGTCVVLLRCYYNLRHAINKPVQQEYQDRTPPEGVREDIFATFMAP